VCNLRLLGQSSPNFATCSMGSGSDFVWGTAFLVEDRGESFQNKNTRLESTEHTSVWDGVIAAFRCARKLVFIVPLKSEMLYFQVGNSEFCEHPTSDSEIRVSKPNGMQHMTNGILRWGVRYLSLPCFPSSLSIYPLSLSTCLLNSATGLWELALPIHVDLTC